MSYSSSSYSHMPSVGLSTEVPKRSKLNQALPMPSLMQIYQTNLSVYSNVGHLMNLVICSYVYWSNVRKTESMSDEQFVTKFFKTLFDCIDGSELGFSGRAMVSFSDRDLNLMFAVIRRMLKSYNMLMSRVERNVLKIFSTHMTLSNLLVASNSFNKVRKAVDSVQHFRSDDPNADVFVALRALFDDYATLTSDKRKLIPLPAATTGLFNQWRAALGTADKQFMYPVDLTAKFAQEHKRRLDQEARERRRFLAEKDLQRANLDSDSDDITITTTDAVVQPIRFAYDASIYSATNVPESVKQAQMKADSSSTRLGGRERKILASWNSFLKEKEQEQMEESRLSSLMSSEEEFPRLQTPSATHQRYVSVYVRNIEGSTKVVSVSPNIVYTYEALHNLICSTFNYPPNLDIIIRKSDKIIESSYIPSDGDSLYVSLRLLGGKKGSKTVTTIVETDNRKPPPRQRVKIPRVVAIQQQKKAAGHKPSAFSKVLESHSRMERDFVEAVTNPFSDRALGARVPDAGLTATSTTHLANKTVFSTDAQGRLAIVVLPNPNCTLFDVQGLLNSSSTISTTSLSKMNSANYSYGASSPATMLNALATYRVAVMGTFVRVLTNETNIAGDILIAPFSMTNTVPGYNAFTSTNESDCMTSTMAGYTPSMLTSVGTVSFPGHKIFSCTQLISQGVQLCHTPYNSTYYNFKTTNAVMNYGTGRVGDTVVVNSAGVVLDTEFKDSTQMVGGTAFIIVVTGAPANTKFLSVEMQIGIEGTPTIATTTTAIPIPTVQPASCAGSTAVIESALARAAKNTIKLVQTVGEVFKHPTARAAVALASSVLI